MENSTGASTEGIRTSGYRKISMEQFLLCIPLFLFLSLDGVYFVMLMSMCVNSGGWGEAGHVPSARAQTTHSRTALPTSSPRKNDFTDVYLWQVRPVIASTSKHGACCMNMKYIVFGIQTVCNFQYIYGRFGMSSTPPASMVLHEHDVHCV